MWMRLFVAVALVSFLSGLEAGDEQASESSMKASIQVHGHWKLTILDPDGSISQEFEFNNSLVSPSLFAAFLSGGIASGGTYVVLNNSGSGGPCGGASCKIAPAGAGTFSPDSTNLVTTLVGTNSETVRFSGSVTATTTSTIDQVQTWLLICGSVTCQTCAASPDSESVLTSKTLTPISITAGQIVQVTVDITFS